MIKEVDFLALKEELSEATIAFEKVDDSYKFYFNRYDSYQNFRSHLTDLYYKYSKELRDNISTLKTRQEIEIYLEIHIRLFELLKDQVDEGFTLENFHHNPKIVSKKNTTIPYIKHSPSELAELMKFFKYQKRIIKKSIKQIKSCKSKFTSNTKSINIPEKSWKDNLQEFYPAFMKIKSELYAIKSINEKMEYIQKTREQLVAEYLDKGLDFYNSPLNLYFEACIDCLKSLSYSCHLHSDKPVYPLKWMATTSDFLELTLSLDQSKSLGMLDETVLSRKELIKQLGEFLNVDPVSDPESRIHKLTVRANRTPFIDRLKKVFILFSNGEKMK